MRESRDPQPGTLYIVATPIGNLEDITLRAARLLGSVDKVLAEDTRRTRTLLTHLGHSTPTISLHDHNERGRIPQVLGWLQGGESLALVSDAGTPAISDPGFPLVRACVEADVRIVPIPGPSALIAAVCAAGLPTDRVYFLGFLPGRPGRAKRALKGATEQPATTVVYVGPHKLPKTLAMAVEIAGADRPACICRELTKVHEEFDRGTLGELVERWTGKKVKGEVTLLIGSPDTVQSPGKNPG
ncbi:MAG: 16S rRNA (cytidine(1402)-2'-O)-methyltransferase [Proteobacteria bacterium]|nr:16S rRNA (cytidine(1402)-2'-O)-methyltransferase [Pseudomonadota bacterium]